ncbi:hypothetical protein OIU77_006552 [Salix suchowensis]|uniref:Uncharacterized protein n=1 Tax=Salix suchowensis TaxID=1278906 RepID=A0ABQ9AMJ3_9ROSI|nr:hypothetical protein OIU77_006552 [Salix suchowensis]
MILISCTNSRRWHKESLTFVFLISLSGYGEKINCKSHSKIASPDHNSWLIFFVPLTFVGLENDCLAKPCQYLPFYSNILY